MAAFDRLEIICILFAGLEIILFMIDGNNPLFKGYKFVHLHNCFTCFHYITTALLDFTIVDKCGIRLQAMHHAPPLQCIKQVSNVSNVKSKGSCIYVCFKHYKTDVYTCNTDTYTCNTDAYTCNNYLIKCLRFHPFNQTMNHK